MHSRTCETLPGEEFSSEKFMVWMESIIAISGRFTRIYSQMDSISVSAMTSRFSAVTPRREARSLIWRSLSSPVTYNTE